MVDTQTVKQSPILTRSTELYMGLCQISATMQTQLNYNNMSGLRGTFKDFRYAMYELFYLVSDTKNFSEGLNKDIKKWRNTNFSKQRERGFYSDSLILFERFKLELERRELIER